MLVDDRAGQAIDAASRLEKQDCIADRFDIVDADDLNSLPSERQGHAHRGGRSVRLRIAQYLCDETFARVADEDGTAQLVKSSGGGQQFEVVLVRFAKPDAGVEADAVAIDPELQQRFAAFDLFQCHAFGHRDAANLKRLVRLRNFVGFEGGEVCSWSTLSPPASMTSLIDSGE